MDREERPPVSIIVPTLNEEKYLPFLLDSLLAVDYPFELIVVDGNSDDATKAVVENYRARFRTPADIHLFHSEQRNISVQRNLGALHAEHEILLFLDADVIVPPNSFAPLIATFYQRGYAVANPRFIAHAHEWTFGLGHVFKLVYVLQHMFVLMGKPYFAGICLLTRRSVFNKVGGFDEILLLSEDTDYAFRVRAYGTYGVLPIKISTSLRRLKRLDARDILEIAKAIPAYLKNGKVANTLAAYYRFGEH